MLVKPLVRPIVRAIAGNPTASLGSGFSPTSLFLDGSKGVVYDNNDLSSFYLDSAGTTAATVNGLVGLQLDKSANLALGAELITNGTFDSGLTGWTNAGDPGFNLGYDGVNQRAILYRDTGGLTRAETTVTTVSGRYYKITFARESQPVDILINNTNTNSLSTSSGTFMFLAVGSSTVLQFRLSSNWPAGIHIDNISVKELPGNHRYQTTTGSKPVLRGTPTGANLVTNGDFASGTGWTAGSGWAIGSGVATATTSSGTLTSTLAATASKNYRVTYTITRSAGSVQVSFGGRTGASRSAAGTYVDYLDSTTNTNALVFTGTTFSGTVDDVEVVDVSAGSVAAPYGLQYDGVDDFMQTAAVDFTATDKMFVCAGVRKLSDAGLAMFTELSVATFSNAGAFYIAVPNNASGAVAAKSRGSIDPAGQATSSIFTAPATRVLTSLFDIAGDSMTIRLNSVVDGTSSSDQGTGNFGNYAFYFGRRGGSSLPYNGLDFGMVICGKTLTSNQISSTERYIAQRTGIAL